MCTCKEELAAKLDAIKKELDAHACEQEPWTPKDGEKYWFVRSDGGIGSFCNTGHAFDRLLFSNNNIFRTKEEAERAFAVIKAALALFKAPKKTIHVRMWNDGTMTIPSFTKSSDAFNKLKDLLTLITNG